MLVRLKSLWEQVRTGLWFLPLLMTLGAVALAWLTLRTRLDVAQVWWLHSGSASDAASLLSSMLASMITMATLAISITMVVLTLAANQLGPRLIRIFMGDRRTQTMLGFFLATIVYVVLVLRSINSELSADNVPNLAVSVGTAMVLACVFLLLFFINHLARSIVADAVINRIGVDLDGAITHMLPDAADSPERDQQPARRDGGAVLRFKLGGYIEGIDHSALVECAKNSGAVIDLDLRPGQHILPHGAHGRVHPSAAADDTLLRTISNHVLLAGERTGNGDLEFLIRQLVEIALRALSPGVNDPFTAVAVIDRLGVSVALIMQRGTAQGVWCDADGEVRLITQSSSFRGLVDVAFNQIRQAGEGQPAILIRLVSTLTPLLEQARDEEQRRVLREHIELVTGAGERSIKDGYDLAALRAVGPGVQNGADRVGQDSSRMPVPGA